MTTHAVTRVRLASLAPNPRRNFRIDPIDKDSVQTLKAGIEDHGFWGGVVCRAINGEIQIAAGHTRVEAAIAAGIVEAEVTVLDDIDDAEMVLIYAQENHTQRGDMGTATAGTVASALKLKAKEKFLSEVPAGTTRSRKSRAKDSVAWSEIRPMQRPSAARAGEPSASF